MSVPRVDHAIRPRGAPRSRFALGAVAICLAVLAAGCDGGSVEGTLTPPPGVDGAQPDSAGAAESSAVALVRESAAGLAAQLPEVDDAAAVRAYLDGDGQGLVKGMHRTAIQLVARPDLPSATCREAAASLEGELPADGAFDVISAVPDDSLAELFISERKALTISLVACIQQDSQVPVPEEQAELVRWAGLVEERLVGVGYR